VEPEKTTRERAEELINLLVPAWRPAPQQALWAMRLVIVLSFLVAIGFYYGITLWDWVKLLIVPAVIAGGGLWFNRQQRERELESAREQREREVEIADRRVQDEALQAYLEQIGNLLLDKDRPLRQSKEGNEVRTLARAQTLTVLRRLDGERKGRVLQFLYDSGLISRECPVLALSKTDLSEADLSEAFLVGANLSGANLSGTVLNGANLSYASLADAKVTPVQPVVAESLEGATMPNGQKYEDWLKNREGRKVDREKE
jgi:hypothetical protein